MRLRNRLSDATSPYLQQHADNPVHWQPWDETALDAARSQDKPILLSIGYSACHWCHVMAHESFEDEATAGLMNRLFVNVKVDREERPDLDKIYQGAQQLLTRRPGGWPLTVFLTPDDHLPFFAGTYFPPSPRHGLIAFKDLLQRVAEAYRDQPDAIREQNQGMQQALARLDEMPPNEEEPDDSVFTAALRQLSASYDDERGGFGRAPKFPHPTNIELLLRRWHAGNAAAGEMAEHTLRAMALGGVNDQLGGGFCRYSVDDDWMIPHFEKMLYDNAQLLPLYADAFVATGNTLYRHVCDSTAAWVMREMQAPAGGYYASSDADSEGEEGRFYVWTPEQVRELLGPEEHGAFASVYGLDRPANFEDRWNLHTYRSPTQVAQDLGQDVTAVESLLASARSKLLEARELRVRPGRDDKILTSWNGLMIAGMARAGRLLGKSDWIRSAERAFDFLDQAHWRGDHLLATSLDGRAELPAYLDDHAFLLLAALELLQARWRGSDLGAAQRLADTLLARFEDTEHGGFYFTAHDHESLIQRPRPLADEAMPAGNGSAALALLRLGHLCAEPRYLRAAERALRHAWPAMRQAPQVHASLLIALEESLHRGELLVVRFEDAPDPAWRALARAYRPQRQVYFIPWRTPELPAWLEAQRGRQSQAFLCRDGQCHAGVAHPDQLG